MSAFGKSGWQLGREHIRQIVGSQPTRTFRVRKKLSRRAPAVSAADNQPVQNGAGVKPLLATDKHE